MSHGNTLHGETAGGARGSREYWIWVGMRRRCNNPKTENFDRYGGRGIKVCERWNDYSAFRADMGPMPEGDYSIERRDVNGDYEPNNCHWATRVEQANNRTNAVRVGGKTLLQIAAETGMAYGGVYRRFRKGMTLEQMLATPKRVWPSQR